MLLIEHLEKRELLANDIPTIIGASPTDGSTVFSTAPTLSVRYSEDMVAAEAGNPANYRLFNSSGTAIPFSVATYDNATRQTTLQLPAGITLTADKYSLFVQGNNIHDVDDNLALARPAQLAVANELSANVSLINIPGNGTLDAASNYATLLGNEQQVAVSLADLNNDGNPELILANSGTNNITIFQGLASGRYSPQAVATLNLPANSQPQAIAVADLNTDNRPDVIIASKGTNSVTIFRNNGNFAFTGATSFPAGPAPVGVVAGDFNADNRVDLATVSSAPDNFNRYNVNVLLANPSSAGTFLAPVTFDTSRTILTGIAAGDLNSDGKSELVVTSTTGTVVMLNASTATAVDFAQGALLTTANTDSVAIGNIDAQPLPDIVVTSKANNQVMIFQNVGGSNFSSPTIVQAGTNPAAVAVGDADFDGKNDIFVANSNDVGTATVLLNRSGTSLAFASPTSYRVDSLPNGIAVAKNAQGFVTQIVTANTGGDNATVLRASPLNNGTFLVSKEFPLSTVGASDVAAGDLNGDKIPDIIVAGQSAFVQPNFVVVLLSNPDGSYGAPRQFNLIQPASFFTTPVVAVANLSNTGILDVVLADPSNNTINILANNGTGDLVTMQPIQLAGTPTGLTVGDFNGDGRQDLAVSEFGGVEILLANGNRSFQPPVAVTINQAIFGVGIVAADFIKDQAGLGVLDLAVLDGSQLSRVILLRGNGNGTFTQFLSPFAAGDNATSIAAGDLNRDGLVDVVVTNQVTTGNQPSTVYVTALLGEAGTGFRGQSIRTNVAIGNFQLQSVELTALDGDPFPDLVATTTGSSINVFSMRGRGDGSFQNIESYSVSGGSNVSPSSLTVASDPFIRATSFTVSSSRVSSNLILNPSFDSVDLTGESGNLLAWKTFKIVDSSGGWNPQTGLISPMSPHQVPAPPDGSFAAMVDSGVVTVPQQSLLSHSFYVPPVKANSNGSHLLYQDFFIPDSADSVQLSMNLFFNLFDQSGQLTFTDPIQNPSLDYRTAAPNLQVRVDILDASANLLDTGAGVLRNVFRTTPLTVAPNGYITLNADLTQFKGRTVRLRIAAVNNRGIDRTDFNRLIVGVDNARAVASYTDTRTPVLNGIHLRNPGFGATATFGGNTTDTTIVGKVSDDGTRNNIASILVDTNNDGNFNGPGDYAITDIDQLGNFQTTLPNVLPNGAQVLPGPITIGFRAVDRAGNFSPEVQKLTFNILGPSNGVWRAEGPGPIRYSGQGVDFGTVTGKVTTVVADPSDPTGNTIYAGSANGGVWKSIDGGKNWTQLTDFIADPTLGDVPVPIGYLAVSPSQPNVLFAATGVADNQAASRPGYGLLRSLDGGATWQVVGNDVFNGATISKVAISFRGTDGTIRIYATVTSGGGGTGVYRSTDNGNTWTNVLVQSNMVLDAGGTVPTTTALASATDIVIDPFSTNNETLWLGLGNIGQLAASTTAGVWFSQNHGSTWLQITGGHDPKTNAGIVINNQNIPTGVNVGRVTIALPTGRSLDKGIAYVMMGTPGTGQFDNDGTSMNRHIDTLANSSIGIYKTRNSGLSWTQVMMKENVPLANDPVHFVNLMISGHEAADVGAMVVDPNDANVVYIGGSKRYFQPGDDAGYADPRHGLIRVDTRNMRDTEYLSPYYTVITYPNDGDDITKAGLAAEEGTQTPREPGQYPAGTNGGAYTGEGVFWVDLQTNDQGSDYAIFFGAPLKLPDTIYDLTFDAQGRLLVGTAGGVFRGVSRNYTYDVTSGGQGIAALKGTPTPPNQGMIFTNLNGNLQIPDVTNVAIDPYERGVYHISAEDTGWSRMDGTLNWESTQDLFPTGFGGLFDSLSWEAPYSGPVVVGAKNPEAAPGTLSTVYRGQKVVITIPILGGNSAQIEVSRGQGGQAGTFTDATQGLPLTFANTSLFLPLAVASKMDLDNSGVFQDTLIYALARIFTSRNSAQNWEPTSTDQLPRAGGGTVSALAVSPGTTHAYYVGTTTGHIYVDTANGANNFPLRNSGIPQRQVNNITIDPNDPLTAYAMIDGIGTGGHVFKTTDGGSSWSDITGNLPDVPAYALVINPKPTPGAPGKKLYVGTGVGVFFSLDEGTTWTRLGDIRNPDGTITQTMPHVPVRDLQINTEYEIIVAATQGRGVFSIGIDTTGPKVASLTPSGPVAPGISAITVNFNEPVDPRTFTLDQVRSLIGPNGQITPLSIVDVDPTTHQTFQINFQPQVLDGIYTVSIGPNIRDFVGNGFDQNGNGVTGEDPADRYTSQFVVNSSDNGRFITGIYHDLVNRSADTGGFVATVTPVDTARFTVLPSVALSLFLTSDEGRGATIYNGQINATHPAATGYYQDLLRRGASQGEINFWVEQLRNGATPAQIIGAIGGSAEYFGQGIVGGTDSGFLDQIFKDLLGRNIDAGSKGALSQNLANAESAARSNVVAGMTSGDEYRRLNTNNTYTQYLRRLPNSAELDFWIGQFRAGLTTQQLIANLVGSPEYFQSGAIVTPSTPTGTDGTNATWVRAAFQDILGRAAEEGAVAGIAARLAAGGSRATVALELTNTDEFRTRYVQQAFQKYLGRGADQGALNFLVASLRNGAPLETVINTLVGSGEYFANKVGGAMTLLQQDTNWVGAAYQDVLSRPADPAGQQAQLDALGAAEANARNAIIQSIVNSNEYLANFVTKTYQTYLGRLPGQGDVNIWLNFLKAAPTPGANQFERFTAEVLGSGEYFARQRDRNNLSTNVQWLTSLYPAVYGRTADAGSLQSNTNVLLNAYQPQRLQAARTLDTTSEYREIQIRSYFQAYLKRQPNAQEIALRVAQIAAGATEQDIIRDIVASDEYVSNVTQRTGDNTLWLNQVYRDLLGRDRDVAGSQGFLDALNSTNPLIRLTKADVAAIILKSAEYRARLVTSYFTKYLGRNPAANDVAFWVAQMETTRNEEVIAQFLASGEYFQKPHLFP